MALNDQNQQPTTPNRRLAGLQAEYAPIRQGYDAASQRVRQLTTAADQLQKQVKPQIIAPRGENFRPTEVVSDVPGGVTALNGVRRQLAEATAKRDSYTQPLQQAAGRFRTFTDETRAQGLASRVGANLPTQTAPAAATAAPVRRLLPSAAAAPNAPKPAAGATAAGGTAFALRPGDANTFTGTDGQTRAVPGLLNDSPPQQGTRAAGAVEEPSATRGGFVARGAQGGVIANPDEERRRLEIALSTIGRGSPSVRRALIEQYGNEQGARQEERMAALNAGYEADVQGLHDDAVMQEGHERRLVDVRIANQEASVDRDRIAADSRQVNRTLTTTDGTAQVLRNDGTTAEVTGPDGKPVRLVGESAGQLTPQDIVEAYTKQQETIAGSVPVGGDPTAAMRQLDQSPLGQAYGRLFGANANGTAAQVPDAAVAYLRANPGTRDQFEARFGAGSAARYLTP